MTITAQRLRWSSRSVLSYVLALLLPPLGSWLTAKIPSLHSVPFSLHFIILVVIAALGGMYPALVGFVVAVLTRSYFIHLVGPVPDLLQYNLTRSLVIFFGVLLVALINGRIRRSELKLQSALEVVQERTDDLIATLGSSKCACWTFDLDSGVSPRWYSGSYPIFGRPFAEIEAMPSILSLIHADDHPRIPQLLQHLRESEEPYEFEYRCLWPNGELHSLEMRANRIPGKRCAWRGVTVDITERKQAEAALLRAEKLAAMGRLASTVAHEINNPLEAVTNLLYLARSSQSTDAEAGSYLAAAERELARLSNITRLTLGFVRTTAKSTDVVVATVVEEVLAIFQHRFETRDVRIERHFQPDVRVVIAPHELRQIVTNLIANAADAVSAGTICVHILTEQGNAVLLIEDSGTGIAESHLSRIFEPFFSTKEEIGTGIGLWVTKELTEKNGGFITVEVAGLPSGIHTRFRVEFPLATSLSGSP